MVFMTRLALATAQRRVPTIKFRKGGSLSGGADHARAAAGTVVSGVQSKAAKAAAASNAIEDWQLPPRYWRKPLDPIEMDYINRGGPA